MHSKFTNIAETGELKTQDQIQSSLFWLRFWFFWQKSVILTWHQVLLYLSLSTWHVGMYSGHSSVRSYIFADVLKLMIIGWTKSYADFWDFDTCFVLSCNLAVFKEKKIAWLLTCHWKLSIFVMSYWLNLRDSCDFWIYVGKYNDYLYLFTQPICRYR